MNSRYSTWPYNGLATAGVLAIAVLLVRSATPERNGLTLSDSDDAGRNAASVEQLVQEGDTPERLPNIVVILADDLGVVAGNRVAIAVVGI